MNKTLDSYLHNIKSRLRLDPSVERGFLREILTHLQDKTAELRQSGSSQDEATTKATLSMGSPEVMAEEMYQAHSRGSWTEAVVAGVPHLLFALFFALHLWQNPLWWLPLMTAILLIVTIYGWWHGRPVWLFPWLGYSLVPLIVASILLLSLPGGWSHLAILVLENNFSSFRQAVRKVRIA